MTQATSTSPASPVARSLDTAPMDPGFAGFLAQAAAQGQPPLETLPPPVARQIYRDLSAALSLPPPDVASVSGRTIEGPGGPLPLRLYTPVGGAPSPLPVVLYVHGGGWVIGDLETHDAVCRRLCHASGMKVMAVEYRLAPEHPFPAAPDDVAAALRWLHANAAELGCDPGRIALAGDSAGAQLALVAARRLAGEVPVRALGLIYPVAQHHSDGGACYAENEGKFLTTGVMKWFGDCYTAQRAAAVAHPDYALLRNGGLEGLPPVWVATMGHDPLRDEGHALALRMEQAAVPTTHRHYPQAIHACIHFTALSPVGGQLVEEMADWLRARV
jgi:acetyl esterase